MGKLKALVTADVYTDMFDGLEDKVTFEYAGYINDYEVLPHAALVGKCKDIDILVSEYDTVGKDVLAVAERLKLIVCCRGGVKTVVDLDFASEAGIRVCNTPGRNADAVSDFAIALMLDLTRNITKADRQIHGRKITSDASTKPDEYADTVWGLDKDSPFIKLRGLSLKGKTLGLVGFGAVGRLVGKKALPFGLKILVFDPFLNRQAIPEGVTVVDDLDQMIKAADVISLHCALTPENHNMFSRKQFAMMKDGAYFINTARGGLVNEADLIDALRSGKLGAAAIDVTTVEPIASDSPLLDVENLIITPHISGSSTDVKEEGTKMAIASIRDYLEKRMPSHCVNCQKMKDAR